MCRRRFASSEVPNGSVTSMELTQSPQTSAATADWQPAKSGFHQSTGPLYDELDLSDTPVWKPVPQFVQKFPLSSGESTILTPTLLD